MINYLILIFTLIFSTAINAAELKGKVVRVLDGDTIEVLQERTPYRIRLLNIDAPEKEQPFGRWSSEQLKRMIAGKSVKVVTRATDRYGRILGLVYTADGREINREMIQIGAAWVYQQYNTDPSLPALEDEARAARSGLWADSNPVPPWVWRHGK